MMHSLRLFIFRMAVWCLTPPIKVSVLPGGRLPERKSLGAEGFDVYVRAIVSNREKDMDPDNPILRRTLFDFEHIPRFDSFDYKDRRILEYITTVPVSETEHGPKFAFRLRPREHVLVGVGFALEMPYPMLEWLAPRSGLATRDRIQLLNAPGTVDSDYRGEAAVLVVNQGDRDFFITRDLRIAQAVFMVAPVPKLKVVPYRELSATERGTSGFGSTGKTG